MWDTLEALEIEGVHRVPVKDKRVYVGSTALSGLRVAVKLIPMYTTAAALDAKVLAAGSELVSAGKSRHFPKLYCKLVVMDHGDLCAALVMERFDQTLEEYLKECIRLEKWNCMYDTVMQAMVALAHGQTLLGLVHNDMRWGNVMVTLEPTSFQFRTSPQGAALRMNAEARVALLDFGRATMGQVFGVNDQGEKAGEWIRPRNVGAGKGVSRESLSVDVQTFSKKLLDFLPKEWILDERNIPEAMRDFMAILRDGQDMKITAPHEWFFHERLVPRYVGGHGRPIPPRETIVDTLPPSTS
jgi:hypothetical protein